MSLKVAPVKRRRLVIQYSDSESEETNVVPKENEEGKRTEKLDQSNKKLNLFKGGHEYKSNGFERTAKSGPITKIERSNGERTRVVNYKPTLNQLNHEKLRSNNDNWEKERRQEKERESFTRRGDGASTYSSSIPVRKRVSLENSSHDKIKQNWRGQTRKMLFDAGWRIEARPSQNCNVAVYISPNGTNYWSIAKAYSAFEASHNNKSIVKRNLHNKKHRNDESPEPSRKSKLGMRKRVKSNETDSDSDSDDYVHYEGKRTVLAWLIDSGVIPEICKVKYIDLKTNKAKLGGKITRDGILCNCCCRILSMSKFELHSGSKENRFYVSIYVEELGVSLMKCLLKAWEKQGVKGFSEIATSVDDPCDDTCPVCGDGGDLMLCDSCPSAYHTACLGFQTLPDGDWHCMNCLCKFCYKTQEKGRKMASVCRLMSCLQCGQKYHEGCVPDKDPVCASSSNNSLCGQSCRKIYWQLQRLLGVRNSIDDGYSWSLVRRLDESSPLYQQRLSHVANCNSKIALAFNVMDECFTPIVDRRSGINLVHNVIYNYGSNFNRLNFDGFYTFVLEHGDEIISVASVRIHGAKLAEMPFIGTRDMYRKQGMCRRLLNGIESALNSLNVKRLVIPAISELKSTWINNFGFNFFDPLLKKQVRSINILMFPDIGLLQKPLASDQKHESAKRVAVSNLGNDTKLNAQRCKIENDLFG
ncbi:hypothetical protein LUZ60_010241 [Juncus effusus]|nr:hypothetical protein LUZ60_010241 [Juncus effusus]